MRSTEGDLKWEWIYGKEGLALLVLSVVVTAFVIVYSIGIRAGGVTVSNTLQTHQYGRLMATYLDFISLWEWGLGLGDNSQDHASGRGLGGWPEPISNESHRLRPRCNCCVDRTRNNPRVSSLKM
jgi:hypothetical protein